MNDRSRILVQESFERIAPLAASAAALFYGRLFELDPALRPLFRSDLETQGRVLMQTIGLAVRSLDRLEELVPVVQALGRRHAGYGVRDEHYALVGSALLWTLEQALGVDFTPELRAAWTETYGLLASTMQAAAAEQAAA
jgi:hemoglobin-like flavoprotein